MSLDPVTMPLPARRSWTDALMKAWLSMQQLPRWRLLRSMLSVWLVLLIPLTVLGAWTYRSAVEELDTRLLAG